MSDFTDPRDGNTYRVVQIGAQRWLAENLRYLPSVCPATTTPDGSALYYVYDYQGRDVSAAKATANYRSYGVLYNWWAALTACPPGWHLPGDAEWTQLTDFLIARYSHINAGNVGFALKSRRQMGSPLGSAYDTSDHPRWECANAPAATGKSGLTTLRRIARRFIEGAARHNTDEFGFTALPGGRCTHGGFYRMGDLGYWWSATKASPLRAWVRQLTLGCTVNRWDVLMEDGFSIRCLQNQSPMDNAGQ